MSFFHDLNKRLADLAKKQDQQHVVESKQAESIAQSPLTQALNEGSYSAKAAAAGKDIGKPGKMFGKIAKGAGERYGSKAAGERVAGAVLNKLRHPKESAEMDESALQAYIGDKKYGKQGMDALRKAGREHVGKEKMNKIRDRYNKMDEGEMEEGNEFSGALTQARAQHKDNFEVDGKTYPVKEGGMPMTAKQKSFAKLAPPVDKITFADKIAGAKKEVDEMLGDVAADAMRKAVGGHHEEMDEGYAEMDAWLKSREAEKGTGRFDKRKVSTGTVYTRKPETFDKDDEETGDAPKSKGRPKGTRRAIGAKGPGVKSKLLQKDAIAEEGEGSKERAYNEIIELLKNSATDINPAIRNRLMRLVRQLNMSEPVQEKAVSKAQQRFMGMVHATQKGERPASGAVSKVAKEMPEKAAKDFAATKHTGLPAKVKAKKTEAAKPDFLDMDKDGDKTEPMKKAAKEKSASKEEKVDETTTSGSVATATAAPKAGKGMQFGKGVYENLDRQYKQALTESMNITVNMNTDEHGSPQKSITVTATDDDADKLAELLKMAGLSQKQEACSDCGSTDCGCEEELDENSPDYPTNTETLPADPELRTYSGGLNGPKSTGQTTTPVIASQLRRQASMEEGVKLERTLSTLYKNYKAK